jgi:hypothetical protein
LAFHFKHKKKLKLKYFLVENGIMLTFLCYYAAFKIEKIEGHTPFLGKRQSEGALYLV